MIITLILTSTLSACLLICFDKWGWLEKYDIYRPSWMPERCMFCFGFWLSMIMCLPLTLVTWDYHFLLIPFCAAPITLKLL